MEINEIEHTAEETNIRVKQIPLKIKPTKKPKKKSKEKNNNLTKKIFSTINIIIVTLLLIINIFIIINIAIKIDNKNINNSTPMNKIPSSSSMLGSWKTVNDGLFSFQDDYNFYWYDSYQHIEDNYFSGTYNYKSGEEALKEMGYTIEEARISFGNNVSIENIYSLNLMPKMAHKGGIDTTGKDLIEDEVWWFILIIKDDKTALGYNKTLDIRYNLTMN